MGEMTTIEKLFALRAAPCFHRLHQSEQSVLAHVALERSFAPGDLVVARNRTPSRLYLVVDGGLVCADGTPVGSIVGAEGVLCGRPSQVDIHAPARAGARGLVIGTAHLFTTVYQCPSLLVALLEGEGRRRAVDKGSGQ